MNVNPYFANTFCKINFSSRSYLCSRESTTCFLSITPLLIICKDNQIFFKSQYFCHTLREFAAQATSRFASVEEGRFLLLRLWSLYFFSLAPRPPVLYRDQGQIVRELKSNTKYFLSIVVTFINSLYHMYITYKQYFNNDCRFISDL